MGFDSQVAAAWVRTSGLHAEVGTGGRAAGTRGATTTSVGVPDLWGTKA